MKPCMTPHPSLTNPPMYDRAGVAHSAKVLDTSHAGVHTGLNGSLPAAVAAY